MDALCNVVPERPLNEWFMTIVADGMTPGELRIKLFERLYRNELEPGHYQAVLCRLRGTSVVD